MMAVGCRVFRPHPWRKGICIDCFSQEGAHSEIARRPSSSNATLEASSIAKVDFGVRRETRSNSSSDNSTARALSPSQKHSPPSTGKFQSTVRELSRTNTSDSASSSCTTERDGESGYDTTTGTQDAALSNSWESPPATMARPQAGSRRASNHECDAAAVPTVEASFHSPDVPAVAAAAAAYSPVGIPGQTIILLDRSVLSTPPAKRLTFVPEHEQQQQRCDTDDDDIVMFLKQCDSSSGSANETEADGGGSSSSSIQLQTYGNLVRPLGGAALSRKESSGYDDSSPDGERFPELRMSPMLQLSPVTITSGTLHGSDGDDDDDDCSVSSTSPSGTPTLCQPSPDSPRSDEQQQLLLHPRPRQRLPHVGASVQANPSRHSAHRKSSPCLLVMDDVVAVATTVSSSSAVTQMQATASLADAEANSRNGVRRTRSEIGVGLVSVAAPLAPASAYRSHSDMAHVAAGGESSSKMSLRRLIRKVCTMNRKDRKELIKNKMAQDERRDSRSRRDTDTSITSCDRRESDMTKSSSESSRPPSGTGFRTPVAHRIPATPANSAISSVANTPVAGGTAAQHQLLLQQQQQQQQHPLSAAKSHSPKRLKRRTEKSAWDRDFSSLDHTRSPTSTNCAGDDHPCVYPFRTPAVQETQPSISWSSLPSLANQRRSSDSTWSNCLASTNYNPVIDDTLDTIQMGLDSVWQRATRLAMRNMPQNVLKAASDWANLELIGYDIGQFQTSTIAHFEYNLHGVTSYFSMEIEMVVSLKRTKSAGAARDVMIREGMPHHFNVLHSCGKLVQRLPIEVECKMDMATSDCISHTCYVTDPLVSYVTGFAFVNANLAGKNLNDAEERVALLLLQLLLALEFAHSRGIVHRHVDLDKMLIGTIDDLSGDRLLLGGFEYALSAAADKKVKVESTEHPPPEWFVYNVNDLMYLGCNIDHLPPEIIGLCDSSPQLDFSCVDAYAVGVFLSELLQVFDDNHPSVLRHVCKAMMAPAPSIRLSLTKARRIIECWLWGPRGWLQPIGGGGADNTPLCRDDIRRWMTARQTALLSSVAARGMLGELTVADLLHSRFLSSARSSHILYGGQWITNLVTSGKI